MSCAHLADCLPAVCPSILHDKNLTFYFFISSMKVVFKGENSADIILGNICHHPMNQFVSNMV